MNGTYVSSLHRTSGRPEIKFLLWPTGLSLLTGVLSLAFAAHPSGWLLYLPNEIAGLVSGIDGIAHSSEHPKAVVLIMGYQWVFLPWYAAVWFIIVSPLKRAVRTAMEAKASSLRPGQRILFVIAVLFLIAYVLGDFGVISFPTFLNAHWAYPLSRASMLLRPIYRSRTALMVYAWISPFCEAGLWYMLCNAIVNIRAFLGFRRADPTAP